MLPLKLAALVFYFGEHYATRVIDIYVSSAIMFSDTLVHNVHLRVVHVVVLIILALENTAIIFNSIRQHFGCFVCVQNYGVHNPTSFVSITMFEVD